MRKKSIVLKEVRALCEKGLFLKQALKELPSGRISYSAIKKWRVRPMIDRYFKAIMDRSEGVQVQAVENAFLKRLLGGKASPIDYIFYLCNRAGDRWKNNSYVKHSGKIDGPGLNVFTPHAMVFSDLPVEIATQGQEQESGQNECQPTQEQKIPERNPV